MNLWTAFVTLEPGGTEIWALISDAEARRLWALADADPRPQVVATEICDIHGRPAAFARVDLDTMRLTKAQPCSAAGA
jgi:hypothetical protein